MDSQSDDGVPPDLNAPPQQAASLDGMFEILIAPIKQQVEHDREEYESKKQRLLEEMSRLAAQRRLLAEQVTALDDGHATKRQRTKETLQRTSAEIMEKWARLASTLE